MTARVVSLHELHGLHGSDDLPRRRTLSPATTLGVRIALLQHDLDQLRSTWQELVEHPERFFETRGKP